MSAHIPASNSQSDQLSIPQLVKFSSIITCLKEHISWHQIHTATAAPITLPPSVVVFSAEVLDVRQETVENVWSTLRNSLWGSVEADSFSDPLRLVRDEGLLELFLTHGMKHELGILLLRLHMAATDYVILQVFIVSSRCPAYASIADVTRLLGVSGCLKHSQSLKGTRRHCLRRTWVPSLHGQRRHHVAVCPIHTCIHHWN